MNSCPDFAMKPERAFECALRLKLIKFIPHRYIACCVVFFQGLGKLSEKVTVKVKPEDVPLSLRAHDVSTHSMTLSWSPPIRLNPQSYKVSSRDAN